LLQYIQKYNIKIDSNVEQALGKHNRKPWPKFINDENKHLATPDAIDLLSKMLLYDHNLRITPKEAM
jgi:casein kinase II subunit alpha